MKKWLGLIGLIVFCITAAMISIGNWQGTHLTLSQHVALGQTTITLFAIFGGIGALLIAYNLILFLPARWSFGVAYKILATLISVCLIGICIFPHTEGLSVVIHFACSWIMLVAIIPFVLIIGTKIWQNVDSLMRSLVVVFLATCLISILSIVLYYFIPTTGDFVFIIEGVLLLPFLCLLVYLTVYDKENRIKNATTNEVD